jgi:hypothetical protein
MNEWKDGIGHGDTDVNKIQQLAAVSKLQKNFLFRA